MARRVDRRGPDSDPGFGDAELARWQALFPNARTVNLHHTGQFIRRRRAGRHRRRASFVVA
jgi:hypothetical protein